MFFRSSRVEVFYRPQIMAPKSEKLAKYFHHRKTDTTTLNFCVRYLIASWNGRRWFFLLVIVFVIVNNAGRVIFSALWQVFNSVPVPVHYKDCRSNKTDGNNWNYNSSGWICTCTHLKIIKLRDFGVRGN